LNPDPDPDWIRIQFGQWIRTRHPVFGIRIRIRIQEGKNDTQKYKKKLKITFFEKLDVLF
jgi:hypothetical protein